MRITAISILLICAFAFCSCAYIYKSPQGDPSEFSWFVPPKPEETAQHSRASFLEIDLKENNGQYVWKGEVPCDSDTQLSFTFLSPIYEFLKIQILPPGKKLVPLQEISKEIVGSYGIDGASYESHSFEFDKPIKGIWQVLVSSNSKEEILSLKKRQTKSTAAAGMLIVGNDSPYQAVAHIDTMRTLTGNTVGYELRLVNSELTEKGTLGDPIVVANVEAELDIVEPNGQEVVIKMHDDGLEGDRAANDGIFYGSLKADIEGLYQASLKLYGSDPEGYPLLRSVESVFQVVKDTVNLAGSAFAVLDKEHQVFDIFVTVNQDSPLSEGKTYKVWSEVWGKNEAGDFVPIAWISGIKEISRDSNGNFVLGSLELNQRWIDRVSVKSDLQLRNLRVSDVDWSIILETAEIIKIDVEEKYQQELPHIPLSQGDKPLDVTTLSMTQGWRTKEYVDASPVNSSLACTITLVHGYCANSNPFPPNDFTNPRVFLGALGQSLSNDQFSKRLISFIEAHPCTVAVGHSQGGMAITHTHNFYVTPFDKTPSNVRLLQSVGTPFQGTALAGSLASLGEIFGAGCGSNNDLTYSGAKSWLSGISNRSKVYYYYTQYGRTKGFIHYCNLGANLVLSWPNDGTTENGYAPLPNGNNQPSNPTEGECHTSDMNYPPQCQNSARNRQMNSYAQ